MSPGQHRIAIYQVDAFTDTPFGGNPAGVVPDAGGLGAARMQLIAREMALSETAFVLPPERGGDLRVRFFTPATEVALCGHATIGTFWLLAERDLLGGRGRRRMAGLHHDDLVLTQETGAGDLEVVIRYDSASGLPQSVMMAQAQPQRLQVLDGAAGARLGRILGAPPDSTGRLSQTGGVPLEVWSTGLPDLLVPVRDLAGLRALAPDMAALAAFSRELGVVSIHAFTLETEGEAAHAQARDFAPAAGIPEESATGTASGALGAYLVAHGLAPAPGADGICRMVLEQGHILGRPSTIQVEVGGGAQQPRDVRVGGRAVVMIEGTMCLPAGTIAGTR